MEISPATPVAGRDAPVRLAAIAPFIWIVVEAFNDPAATVNVAVAKIPSLTALALIPKSTQVVPPGTLEQLTLFPAAVAFAAAATLTLETSTAG